MNTTDPETSVPSEADSAGRVDSRSGDVARFRRLTRPTALTAPMPARLCAGAFALSILPPDRWPQFIRHVAT